MLPLLVMLLKKELLLRKKKSRRQSRARVGTWPRDDSYRHDYIAVDAVVDGGYGYAGSGRDRGGAGYGCCDTEDVHMHQMHLHYIGNAVGLTVADAVGSPAGKEEEAPERKDAGSCSPWQQLQMTEMMIEWKSER